MKIRYTILIFLLTFFVSAQPKNEFKYKEIDELIDSNSMINSINAIRKLKENFEKDTVNSAYWLRLSKASFVTFRYEIALSSIEKAIKIDSINAELYFEKGLLNNKMDRLEIALLSFEKSITIKKSGKYYFWKGIMNQQLRRLDKVEIDYQNAIDNKFESAELYTNFAVVLTQVDKNEKALSMINKAILLDNKYPAAYSARSKIYISLLNVDAACKDEDLIKKMGQENHFQIPDSICRGTLNQKLQFASDFCSSSGSYKQGIIGYSKLINSKIFKSDNFLNRGYCYFQIKEYEKAENDYLKALSLPKPSLSQLYDNLGTLYFNSNNFQRAIEYATKRIELNPNDHIAFLDRGICYRKLNNYINAEKDFDKSIELKPNFYRAFGHRSFLFLIQGQNKKSFDDASKSIKLNRQYGYGYLVLAQSKQILGIPDFCKDFYNAKKFGEIEADTKIIEFCN
ncbi:tetratricopeptide repeat protein [Flavobacterium psychrophilum]|nr:tetratricopeptide repeat protein [Flavobacterium psychrophilum]